jgi:hypothetical protein
MTFDKKLLLLGLIFCCGIVIWLVLELNRFVPDPVCTQTLLACVR